MRLTQRGLARVIDLIGGALVAVSAVSFFWLLTVGTERTRTEIAELKRSVSKAQAEMRTLQTTQSGHEKTLGEYKSALEYTGQLPDRAPIEEYFRSLSTLASDFGLRVQRHQPIAAQRYAGLLEQRYRYEVAGPTRGLVLFLEAIERADFWADVSYLKIEAGASGNSQSVSDPGAAQGTRQASFTLSLFSAPPPSADESSTGDT